MLETVRAESISTKATAILIRQTIKTAFPGITFSVRTHSYSMGSHVSIHWTDGPATHQVDAAIGHFCGKTRRPARLAQAQEGQS